MEDKLKVIKQVILDIASKHGVEVDRIILFGSRARGDYSEDSDWDILIVTKKKLDKETKEKLWLEVGRMLVRHEIIPEIIIASSEEMRKYGRYYGFVHYQALTEGKVL